MGKTIIKNCDIADFDTLKYDRKDILIEDDLIVKLPILFRRKETKR